MARHKWPLLTCVSVAAIAACLPACAPLEYEAVVCDDTLEPDCAPDREVEVN